MTKNNELGPWRDECMKWRGRVLEGKAAHYCSDWDGLPVDETTDEIECCTCKCECGALFKVCRQKRCAPIERDL